MNFIKKKLKSHKKDDEEEEYEKAVYEQSLHPQNPDQQMKSSEEWQFFQQLSMRVQDTVQKTQTTLNKLKDTRQEDMDEDEVNDYNTDGELLSKDIPPYGKVLKAPPRPPPPSAEKSAISADLDFGSDLNHSSPAKGPPRPPPPVSSDAPFSFDSSALQGTTSKSYGTPARPPPPNAAKFEPIVASDNFPDSKLSNISAEKDNSSSLLDEFGFFSDPAPMSAVTNMQDLLFLDDKVVDDPFDTSFVDVNNPTSVISSERKSSGTDIKGIDKSFNPFSSTATSDDWLTNTTSVETGKNSTSNPFFSNILSEPKPEISQDKRHSISSHNPFFSEPVSTSNAQDDLFGLTILPTSSKDNLTDDIFQPIKDSSKTEQSNEDLLSTAFSDGSTKLTDELDSMILPKDTGIQNEPPVANHKETVLNEDNVWQTEPQNELKDILSSGGTENVESSDTLEKPLETSSIWDIDPVNAISSPEKPTAESETSYVFDQNKESIENKATVDVLENDSEVCSEPVLSAKPSFPLDTKDNNKTIEPTPVDTDLAPEPIALKTEGAVELDLDAINSPVQNGNQIELNSDISHDFDSKPLKSKEVTDQSSTELKKENFSKPFEEENNDAFLFKVKSVDKQSDFEFDAFAAKFESVKDSQGSDAFDPFMSKRAPTLRKIQEDHKGFDSMDEFDPFKITVRSQDFEEQNTMKKELSRDSFEDYDNEVDFSVVIRPKVKDSTDVKLTSMEPPKLLPPPKTPTKAFDTPASRFNPFDKDFLDNAEVTKAAEKSFASIEIEEEPVPALGEAGVRKSDSVETPLSPLFDEDTSLPLETFPKPYDKEGWDMVLRQPNKKKLTGNRFWKKIFVKLSENSVLQLFNKSDDKLPFQELPLQDSLENFATGVLTNLGLWI